jgi:hypothetical protein
MQALVGRYLVRISMKLPERLQAFVEQPTEILRLLPAIITLLEEVNRDDKIHTFLI